MAKEIHEQPEVVGHTLARYVDMATERVALPVKLPFDFKDIQRISITACGTASYAGYVAKYWFERLAPRCRSNSMSPPNSAIARRRLRKGDLAIFISQSGETADTLAALRYAKAQGVHTLSVVNVPTSTIARESETVLPTLAGPEIGVASTKAFTCQLMVLAALAVAAGKARGELSDADEAKLVHGAGRDSAPDGGGARDRAADREAGARHRQVARTCSISAAAPAIRWRWKAR